MSNNLNNTAFAPIVLFVYNRPWHTQQTLNALANNELAKESILYIFADGPKENSNSEDLKKIHDVEKIIGDQKGFKNVIIRKSFFNKGLADSIVNGVTEIVNNFGKIIVLEDDIITSPGFLRYMNDALNYYAEEGTVYHISGYMFPVKKKLPSNFFYNTASCWGWGTWKRAWSEYNNNAELLIDEIDKSGRINEFNIENSYDFYGQLNANRTGQLKTWAVKWYASFFLKKGHSLHPYPSLVNNIGHDGMGENCAASNVFQWKELAKNIFVKKINLKASHTSLKAMIKYNNSLNNQVRDSFLIRNKKKSKNIISKMLPPNLKHNLKMIIYKKFREEQLENKRLKIFPRYQLTETVLLDRKIKIADAASYLFLIKEIFTQNIYNFTSKNNNPFIIDCGANIGISVIYFKQLYPDAEILAFEPDTSIYKLLNHNVKIFALSDVTLVEKAVWNEDTILKFYSEGADGGRAATNVDMEKIIEVEAVRLKKFLTRKVDFLKIDIEGAETEVLEDIKDVLINVDKIFVEYHSYLGKEQKLPEILNILKKSGFRIHVTAPGLTSPNPFLEIQTYSGMDNQLNIYGFR